MVFHFPAKGQRFLFTLIGFLTCMAAILVSLIYILENLVTTIFARLNIDFT